MRRLHAVSVLLLVSAWPVVAAEKLAPLDADFLEYLASFGSDEEDWLLFADGEATPEPPPPAKEPAAKREGSKTQAATKPAEQR